MGRRFTAGFSNRKPVNFHKPWLRNKLCDTTKHYVILKSREEGEKDLEKIAAEGSREACWMYAHEASAWYNLATEYIEGTESISIVSYSLDFSEIGTGFTHYHTHQKKGEGELLRQAIKATMRNDAERIDKMQKQEICLYQRSLIAIIMALPSDMDIYAYYYTTQQNPKCKINFKIANPYGITSVKLLEKSTEPKKAAEDYNEAYNQTMAYGQMGVYTDMKIMEAITDAIDSLNICFENVLELSIKPYKSQSKRL